MSEKPRRVRAKEAYVRVISSGTPISPKEFSRRALAFMGERVAYETIRYWYKEDGWADSVVLDGFGDSAELARTRAFMAGSVVVIMNKDGDYVSRDVCSAATEYRKMALKLPVPFWPIIEEEVEMVRERLWDIYQDLKDTKVSRTALSRISSAWADLAKFVIEDNEASADATFIADSLILGQRNN